MSLRTLPKVIRQTSVRVEIPSWHVRLQSHCIWWLLAAAENTKNPEIVEAGWCGTLGIS